MELYFNRYEVTDELGRGTYGLVLRAKDLKTGLPCALKIFSLDGPMLKKISIPSFQAELSALKNCNHPSVAKIYDAGFSEEHRECYFVSELINGQDLFSATEGLSFSVIESLFIEALRALNYLHQQKVFHFDIKPQNLLVISDVKRRPCLKIIDFGLANFYDQASNGQNSKKIIGTPAYAAPEIIRGGSRDGRADLYSLGATFYKVFTRRLPFIATESEDMYQLHLRAEAPPPTSLNPKLPPYLDGLFARLLAKNPEERYQSAAAVIDAISLLSERSYPIETEETLVSYLPEKGALVGRKTEFSRFMETFQDRLIDQTFSKAPYLFILGKKGTGKTRFLESARQEAQKNLIPTFSWDEFTKLGAEGLQASSFLIWGDNFFESKEEDTGHFLELFFGQKPYLFIFAIAGDPPDCPAENIICLDNFSAEETRAYIEKTTGLSSTISPKIQDSIFKHTDGNPLFLAEYVKILLAKGVFKDAEGTWSSQMLDDLSAEIENIGVSGLIKKNLLEHLQAANLGAAAWEALILFALTDDISSLSPKLQKALSSLQQFSNPVYRDLVLENATLSQKTVFSKMIPSLLSLSKGRGDQGMYPEAKKILSFAEKLPNLAVGAQRQAWLDLSELCMNLGEIDEAKVWLSKIKPSDDLISIQALEVMARVETRMTLSDRAVSLCQEGLRQIKGKKDFRWLQALLQNTLAGAEFKLGHTEEAAKIFEESWKTWKSLSDQEKLLSVRIDIDNFYYLTRDFKKLISIYEEILALLDQHPYHPLYPDVLYKLGRTFLRTGDFAKADLFLKKCLEILKVRKTSYWLYTVYNELGNLEMMKKNWEQTLFYYQHSFRLVKKAGQPGLMGAVVFNIGHAYLQLSNLAEASKYFEFGVRNLKQKILEKNPDSYEGVYLFLNLMGLAEVSRKQSLLEKSVQAFAEAHTLWRENDYLKSYEQYIWQEKADLARALKNPADLKTSLTEIDRLKHTSGFNQETYEFWKSEGGY